MKKALLILLPLLLLTSCKTGDLLTVYSEQTYPDASASTETAESSSAAVDTGTILLLSLTEKVGRGETASVEVIGEPNKEYSITVFYSSGPSTAAGLESKRSDANGCVSWSWRVGSRTRAGEYKIEITGENELLTLYFTVEE